MSRYDESQLTRLPRGEESTGSASAKRRRFATPLPEVPPTEPTVTGTVGDPTGGAAPELRRGQRAPRRKRRSRWLSLVRPAATAIFLVALPTAVGLWLLTSPRFALAELEVTVGERVEQSWVEGRLEPLVGHNLVRLPLAEVERRLDGHPWIGSVSIRKQLPAALSVEVEERRPAARVPGADGLWLADASGRPIVPAEGVAGEDGFLLVLPPPWPPEGAAARRAASAAVPRALAVAAELALTRPAWAAGLERAEALGGDEFRLVTEALPFPLLVRAGEIEPGAEYLAAALPALAARIGDLAVADLRFPGRLVLRPAADDSRMVSPATADSASMNATGKKVS